MKTRNHIQMHTLQWGKDCYEILDYGLKLSQIKLPIFPVFRGLQEFNILEIYIYVNKAITADVTDILQEQRYLK